MIEIFPISQDAADYGSLDEFYEKYKTAVAESYEDYKKNGHEWCWCLVGNIVEQHEYGEEHEIKKGTQQFSPGAKVYLAPAQWGDGYEYIVVIGLPRHGGKYIEIVIRSKYVENYRMQKVFKPAVLERMCNSQYFWWGDTDKDRNEIIQYLESRVPEKTKEARLKYDRNSGK